MSKFTKQMIRLKCLELLETKPLDKVTVKEIVTSCDINRNTFYYHYQDIYDVIEDIFVIESERVQQKQDINTSFYEAYLDSAKLFIKYKRAIFHIYHSKNKDILEKYFNEIVNTFVGKYVKKHIAERNVFPSDEQFIVEFYSSYIINNTEKWIEEGMNQDYLDFLVRVSDTFESTIDVLVDLCEKNQYGKN